MLFGYDQGVMGSLLTGPSFEATFPSISNGNSTLQGFAVSLDGFQYWFADANVRRSQYTN